MYVTSPKCAHERIPFFFASMYANVNEYQLDDSIVNKTPSTYTMPYNRIPIFHCITPSLGEEAQQGFWVTAAGPNEDCGWIHAFHACVWLNKMKRSEQQTEKSFSLAPTCYYTTKCPPPVSLQISDPLIWALPNPSLPWSRSALLFPSKRHSPRCSTTRLHPCPSFLTTIPRSSVLSISLTSCSIWLAKARLPLKRKSWSWAILLKMSWDWIQTEKAIAFIRWTAKTSWLRWALFFF